MHYLVSFKAVKVHKLSSGLPWIPINSLTMLAKQRTALWELISKEYWNQSQAEANQLENHCYCHLRDKLIESSSLNVLDIGAGFAGYNILFLQKYSKACLSVLDASQEDESFKLGFQDQGEKYCDFETLDFLFRHAGVSSDRYELIDFRQLDILNWAISRSGQYDVVQSLFSWCFHYPYKVYRDAVKLLLKSDGLLIVDCRNTGDQLNEIQSDFQYVATVHAANTTSTRVILRNSKSLNA